MLPDMEAPRKETRRAPRPTPTPNDEPTRGHPAQHEMLRRDLPKKDVAEALDEFDGDEN
jgi:hypothetical protein